VLLLHEKKNAYQFGIPVDCARNFYDPDDKGDLMYFLHSNLRMGSEMSSQSGNNVHEKRNEFLNKVEQERKVPDCSGSDNEDSRDAPATKPKGAFLEASARPSAQAQSRPKPSACSYRGG